MTSTAAKTGRRKPSQERSARTVEIIIEATARVLEEDGYDRLSTNRVAAVAGVSIGSLYQYFPNKQALVGAVLEREMGRVTETIRQGIQDNLTAPFPLFAQALVRALLQSHRENAGLRRVMMEQVPRLGLLGSFEDNVERLQHLLMGVIEARGDAVRPKDLELACFVLVHAIAGATRASIYRRPERLHDDELIVEITALVCRYLEPERSEVQASMI